MPIGLTLDTTARKFKITPSLQHVTSFHYFVLLIEVFSLYLAAGVLLNFVLVIL